MLLSDTLYETLSAADYGRQFVVLLQRKPYLAVWAIRLEEFPLQVRTHIAGINLHRLPPYNQGRLFARPQVRTSLIHQTQSRPYYSSFPLNFFKEYILMKFPSAVSPRAAGNAQLLPVPFMLTTRQ